MEGRGKEKGGWEEGRKKKHPTPHTALNNEGLLGVWAVCGPDERVVYAGKLLCLQEFHRLLMAGVFPLSQASVRAPHNSMKTFVIPIKSVSVDRAAPVNTTAASFTRLDISNSATQFSWLAAENYQAKCGMDRRGRVGQKKIINKQADKGCS